MIGDHGSKAEKLKPLSSFYDTKSNHGDGNVGQHRGKESAPFCFNAKQQENNAVNEPAYT